MQDGGRRGKYTRKSIGQGRLLDVRYIGGSITKGRRHSSEREVICLSNV